LTARIAAVLVFLARSVGMAAALLLLIGLAQDAAWPLAACAAWSGWAGAALAAASALRLATRPPSWPWPGVWALALFWGAWHAWETPARPADPAWAGPGVRVAVVNAFRHNRRIEEAARTAARQQPDVLVVLEATREVRDAMLRHVVHHHAWWAPEGDGVHGGVLVLSRYAPQGDARIAPPEGSFGRDAVEVVLQAPFGPMRLLAAHPRSPLSEPARQERALVLAGLSLRLRQPGPPTVVAGDLNVTPRIRDWRHLDPDGRLAGATPWWIGTFPARFGAAGIAIDHILAGPGLTTVGPAAFDVPGSDHRGILSEIRPAR
jgi:endonuclease/exonuclease/phosphatase family metal-dependent hydrolase